MKHLVKFVQFLWNHLLKKLWFWLVIALAITFAICGAFGVPFIGTVFGPIGQIILGVAISPFVIIFVWLVVLTVDGGRLRRIPWRNIAYVILLLAAAFWYFKYYAPAHPEQGENQTQQTNKTPAQVGPVQPPVVVIQKMGKEKTLYPFPSDGCVSVFLHGNWSDYPKGGEISFTSIASGDVVLKDKPGRQSNSSLPPGDYQICKVDPKATGVEIWQ
jgi:hypothetical protein